MQDRYVGDIGDFAKYGLLRALGAGRQLGVAWYLHPDEYRPDGMKIGYLNEPGNWRHLDKDLFDALNGVITRWQAGEGQRCVAEIERLDLLRGARFAGNLLHTDIPPAQWRQRRDWRQNWFNDVMASLADCDIVFADPDNGLCLDARYSASRQKDLKRLPVAEALLLSRKRTAVLYHHNTRKPGGHRKEIRCWINKLHNCAGAFYCNQNGFRTFFVITHDDEIKSKLNEFGKTWQQAGELIKPEN